MAGERTYAILPCRALDEVIPFYEALGFHVSYRQERPNPYAVVRREDLQLHFTGIEGFAPESSYGSVIVVVADPTRGRARRHPASALRAGRTGWRRIVTASSGASGSNPGLASRDALA